MKIISKTALYLKYIPYLCLSIIFESVIHLSFSLLSSCVVSLNTHTNLHKCLGLVIYVSHLRQLPTLKTE